MTIAQLLQTATATLASAGSDEPEANAQWLVAFVLGVTRTWVLANADFEISAKDQAQFEKLLTRKAEGEPLSHITGVQPFCGLDINRVRYGVASVDGPIAMLELQDAGLHLRRRKQKTDRRGISGGARRAVEIHVALFGRDEIERQVRRVARAVKETAGDRTIVAGRRTNAGVGELRFIGNNRHIRGTLVQRGIGGTVVANATQP